MIRKIDEITLVLFGLRKSLIFFIVTKWIINHTRTRDTTNEISHPIVLGNIGTNDSGEE
jgi:hypothetical protein